MSDACGGYRTCAWCYWAKNRIKWQHCLDLCVAPLKCRIVGKPSDLGRFGVRKRHLRSKSHQLTLAGVTTEVSHHLSHGTLSDDAKPSVLCCCIGAFLDTSCCACLLVGFRSQWYSVVWLNVSVRLETKSVHCRGAIQPAALSPSYD